MKTKFLVTGSILLLFFIALGAMKPHPYHVSYTEVNYVPTDKELTFSIEVFTDDLENAIKLEYKPEKFFLGNDSISAESETYIHTYIKDQFSVIIDGIVLKEPVFVGIESKTDRTIIYFSFANLPPFQSLAVYNTILLSMFPDQQNIIEFTENGTKHKSLLTKEKNNVTWIIKH